MATIATAADEIRFRTLFATMPVGAARVDADGRVLAVNAALGTLLGYRLDELCGRHIREILHPDDQPEWRRFEAKVALRDGEQAAVTLRIAHSNGAAVLATVTASGVWDERNQLQELIVFVAQPVLPLAGEPAIPDSTAHLLTMIESITDGFFAVDLTWTITYINATAERVLGQPRSEIVGRNLWDVVPAARDSSFSHALPRALATQETVRIEDFYAARGRWFEVSVLPSSAGLSVYFHDVTDRKQADQELERLRRQHDLILNSIGEGIIGLDPHGLITFVNPEAAAMLGYETAELIGQPRHELIHHTRPNGMPNPQHHCPVNRSIRDGVVVQVDSDVFWKKSGVGIPVAYTSTPLREDDAIIGAVLAFQNTAERRRAEGRQATQFAVTQVMAQAESLEEAIPALLRAICTRMEWELGEFWRVDQRAGVLRWAGGWYALTVHAAEFEIYSRMFTFAPGVGLPGRVWASRQPIWIPNVLAEPTFLRAELAVSHGLQTALAVPIRNGRELIGVFVCFSRAMRSPEADQLTLMSDIGSQIGQFIGRKEANAAVERSAVRLAALHRIDRAILAAESPGEIAAAALRHIGGLVPCHFARVEVRDDPLSLPRILASHHAEPSASRGEGSLERIPLVAHGSLIGELVVERSGDDISGDEVHGVLQEVAAQLAIAIYHARLFEQLQSAHERLQALSTRLLEIQEAERRHIARELHDEIGQSLTAVQLNLQSLTSLNDLEQLAEQLDDSMSLVEHVLQQVRTLSLDLRPSLLDDLGLVAALRWYVKRHAARAGFVVNIAAERVPQRLPSDIETASFRVAQEAITNIIRYARATDVHLSLSITDGDLWLTVADNGIGFDVAAAEARAARGGSLGVLGMQERASLVGGACEIRSAPGQGTTITAHFPLRRPAALTAWEGIAPDGHDPSDARGRP